MEKINIKLTNEQVLNGVNLKIIYWELMNKYGMVYPLMISHDNELVIRFPEETNEERRNEVKYFIEHLKGEHANKKLDSQADFLTETINCYNRKKAIIKAIKENNIENLEVKYFPTATGCLDKGTYENYQRWYFSRSLTEEEKRIVEEAIKLPLVWEKYG